MNVLLVDDHPSLRRGISLLIDDLGWNVAGQAGTVAEARAQMNQVEWDFAVLDVNLPDGDGVDFLVELRKAGHNHPVLVHSMLPDSAVAARVFKSGGNGYINKGISPDELQDAMKKLAAGGRYVSREYAEEIATGLSEGKPAAPHEQLSPREYKVMVLLAAGQSPGQVAENIGCSVNTISGYRSRILKKLDLKSTMDIVRYALSRQLVNL